MAKRIHRLTLTIAAVEDIAPGIRAFTLTDPEHWPLPPFTAGAHLDLHLPSGRIRQYSLCGDPAETGQYRIMVQQEPEGRGGSREMHDLGPGTELLASLPRNHFPLADGAARHVMVAGGIGITPFLSMLPVLDRENADWVLHVCARTPDRLADGGARAQREGAGRIAHHLSAEGTRLDLDGLVAGLGPQDHLYCCGPARMIDAVLAAGAGLGDRLHVERFGFDGDVAGAAYLVELAQSGRVIPVAAGQTMLEALRAAGIEMPASCEGGACLECKTRYLSGTPVHRDLLMSAEDRRQFVTPCVSGCADGRLVLAL